MENKEKKVITSPVKAIRAYCLECVCGNAYEVKMCPIEDCPLYPFRFGKNVFRTTKEMTEEQRAAAAERLKKAREARLSKNSQ